jgi:hypothetical protein
MTQAVVAEAGILLVLKKTQSTGFDFLFARLKTLAVVVWKLAELEDDEQPAGSQGIVTTRT